VIVYTVHRFSPVTALAGRLPRFILRLAQRLVSGEPRTPLYPSFYRMNTRGTLRRLFGQAGFIEEHFCFLDDCRTTLRWPLLNISELCLWRILRGFALHYPEVCLCGTGGSFELLAADCRV
jgi:hypothetical protein